MIKNGKGRWNAAKDQNGKLSSEDRIYVRESVALAVIYAIFITLYLLISRGVVYISYTIWGTDWKYLITLGVYFSGGVWLSSLRGKMKLLLRSDAAFLIIIGAMTLSGNYPAWMNTLLLPYVIISLCEAAKPLRADFFNKWDIAYGLYLWAFPIQQLVILVGNVRHGLSMGPIKVTALSLLFIVPLAVLQKVLIERPVSRLVSGNKRGSECRVN